MSEEKRPGRRLKPIADDVPPARRDFAIALRDLVERSLPEHTPAGALAPLVPMAKSTLFHYLSGSRLPTVRALEDLVSVCWTVQHAPEMLQLSPGEAEMGIDRIVPPQGAVMKWTRALKAAYAEELDQRVRSIRTDEDLARDHAAAIALADRHRRSELPYHRPAPAEESPSVADAMRDVQLAYAQLGRAQARLGRALAREGQVLPGRLEEDVDALSAEFDGFREERDVQAAHQRIQRLLDWAERQSDRQASTNRVPPEVQRRAREVAKRLLELDSKLGWTYTEPDPDKRRQARDEIYRLLELQEQGASGWRPTARTDETRAGTVHRRDSDVRP